VMTDGLQLVDLAARSSRFLHPLAGLVADLEREQVVLRVVGRRHECCCITAGVLVESEHAFARFDAVVTVLRFACGLVSEAAFEKSMGDSTPVPV
jgi:hypothetical protein